MIKNIKRLILVFFIAVGMTNFSIVNAEDDNENLDLDTEELKNKNENYSSLTDINGMNLFTSDLQKILENKKQEEASSNSMKKLFINESSRKDHVDEKENLFKQPVSFDNTTDVDQYQVTLELVIAIFTIIGAVIVFIVTRKKYRRKINETNNYFD